MTKYNCCRPSSLASALKINSPLAGKKLSVDNLVLHKLFKVNNWPFNGVVFVKGQSNYTDSGKSIASKNRSYKFIKLSTYMSISNSSYYRLLPCHPIRSAVNRRGEILPKHQRDQNFNLNDFVRSLRLGEYFFFLYVRIKIKWKRKFHSSPNKDSKLVRKNTGWLLVFI